MRLRDWLAFCAFFGLVGVSLVFIGLTPRAGDAVAVVAAPWQPESTVMKIVAAADGRYVRNGFADWIVVASSDDPQFVERLYSAGAWVVADPAAAGACIVNGRQS